MFSRRFATFSRRKIPVAHRLEVARRPRPAKRLEEAEGQLLVELCCERQQIAKQQRVDCLPRMLPGRQNFWCRQHLGKSEFHSLARSLSTADFVRRFSVQLSASRLFLSFGG